MCPHVFQQVQGSGHSHFTDRPGCWLNDMQFFCLQWWPVKAPCQVRGYQTKRKECLTWVMVFCEVYLYVSSKAMSGLSQQCRRPSKTFMSVKNDTVQWAKFQVTRDSLVTLEG